MKPNHNKVLKAYNEACDKLAIEFVDTYFPTGPEGDEPEMDWEAETSGGILCVNDYYICMDTMVQALDANCKEEDFFKWYDKAAESGGYIKLKTYLKLNP